ncbi:CLIP domain-containing serine protease 2-like [Thrips palmi]|uniref:CLIP domain-containing serine protease 2-like n=1 Tax=Thrips palmi TaxID=161013 RepID=A0A6P8ZZG5_THRPL|nr:CLIP domain-containing serine protease 2-like [Thrips palmi]
MRGSLPLLLLTLDILCTPWPRVHSLQAGFLTGVTPSWSAAGSTAGVGRPSSTASTATGHHTVFKTASSAGQQVTQAQNQVRHTASTVSTASVGDVLHDDEDPPVSYASPPFDSAGIAHSDGAQADNNMDVRSNSPNGAHQQQQPVASDASPFHDPAVGGVGLGNEDEDQVHPNWHLVNAKKCGLSKGALADRIVGGFVAGLGQYPWLARIGYNLDGVARRVYRCAGAVITHFHVLTAAHCVKNLPENFEFAGVRLGEWDTTTDPDCQYSVCAPPVYDIDPEFVIVHQDYNNPRFANDIALVKLAQKINFNGWVAPVCILYGDLLTKSFEQERTEVAGWGIFDLTLQKSSQELRTVHLPVVSNSICHALYRNQANITKRQMCAGGEIGFDACSGDSGGPLLKVEAYNGGPRYYIVGIVSFGSKRCGLTPSPGVYTRVSYYIDWILDNIGLI